MQRIFKFVPGLMIAAVCSAFNPVSAGENGNLPDDKNMPSLLSSSIGSPAFVRHCDSVYESIGLLTYGLERDVFSKAYKGYQYLLNKGVLRKTSTLTICDYSQSSNNKRLYVIDLKEGKLLYNTYVSHGKNSGQEFATSFSNITNSNKSSLGFLVTAETYSGKAGYSMRFDGMESGVNDKVRMRDIVLHGSRFVNEHFMDMRGAIGKSLGCPAVPLVQAKKIIDAIKGGSCFYVNHPDDWYTRTSTILNANVDLMLSPAATAVNPSPAVVNPELGEHNSSPAKML
ncbi:murein L,D-transpeptidase catalytic domain family protein [Segetibacter sp. 3557_3]|uniref:murein L,D-transpeptidase catalytic domain family protein n=1 Tax=Segetibacter sp. 3557_3 TaxID=2547429 RepID=UPI0010583B7E|nr:murein L,D-transpeptidase catalytic domain family protein [Segetibacter sp. 3557_3]TDH18331.1 murein L,D-transpeptidase catalytic domain family protein [Segetibacter sp. 3557_3]